MSKRGWWHEPHGGRFHDQVIYAVKYRVIALGGEVLDPTGFDKKYNCPCKPDVLFRLNGNTYVVEVETRATKQSRQTKWLQYKDSTAGIKDLIVLDMSDLVAQNNWRAIDKFVEDGMPVD
jgi:hypothetical protein